MPDRLVVVVGTGTEVGKTWVAAAVARSLIAGGARVAARKPAQSFGPDDVLDSEVLAAATGERAEDVCLSHRCYELPMAPPMAAVALGRAPILLADLLEELQWPAGIDVGLVETAGGVRSPIADDGDNVDFALALAPDTVLLVADAGLGTINVVRLASDALRGHHLVVVLNRYDDSIELHRANRAWLTDRDGLDVVVDAEVAASRL